MSDRLPLLMQELSEPPAKSGQRLGLPIVCQEVSKSGTPLNYSRLYAAVMRGEVPASKGYRSGWTIDAADLPRVIKLFTSHD